MYVRFMDAVISEMVKHLPNHHVILTNRSATGELPRVSDFYRFLSLGKTTFNTGYLQAQMAPIQTARSVEAMLARTALLEESPAALARGYVPFAHFLPVAQAAQAVAYTQFLASHAEHLRRLVDSAIECVDACYSARHFWTQLEACA